MRVAYLKVHRQSNIMIPCVKGWVETFKCDPTSKVFFVCDRPEVKSQIEKEVDLSGLDFEWIESNRTDPEVTFILNVCIDQKPFDYDKTKWKNTAYAHFTTFVHARQHGFKSFWNIDADDIRFFAPPPNL